MTSERSIETTGETVEEAIAKGLSELGVSPSDVIVEVLEEPGRGIFGLGARPALVRLQVLNIPKPPPPPSAPPAPVVPESRPAPMADQPPPRQEREQPREARRERPPRRQEPPRMDIEVGDGEEDAASLMTDTYDDIPEVEVEEEGQVGLVVLNELLEKMDVRARVTVKRARPTRDGESMPYVLDISGGDLTRLIGRRGDTLAALQYVTRLITSRELQRRANLIVDVSGYKLRRARMLYGLALRMADQAVERARTVALEPMPPHERRIIHLALREREDVSTRSIGEGSARKVTIVPNNES